jgi:hypothetical protein
MSKENAAWIESPARQAVYSLNFSMQERAVPRLLLPKSMGLRSLPINTKENPIIAPAKAFSSPS